MSDFDAQVYYWINQIRITPRLFIPLAEQRISKLESQDLAKTGQDVDTTKKDSTGLNDLIQLRDFLQKQRPLPELKWRDDLKKKAAISIKNMQEKQDN